MLASPAFPLRAVRVGALYVLGAAAGLLAFALLTGRAFGRSGPGVAFVGGGAGLGLGLLAGVNAILHGRALRRFATARLVASDDELVLEIRDRMIWSVRKSDIFATTTRANPWALGYRHNFAVILAREPGCEPGSRHEPIRDPELSFSIGAGIVALLLPGTFRSSIRRVVRHVEHWADLSAAGPVGRPQLTILWSARPHAYVPGPADVATLSHRRGECPCCRIRMRLRAAYSVAPTCAECGTHLTPVVCSPIVRVGVLIGLAGLGDIVGWSPAPGPEGWRFAAAWALVCMGLAVLRPLMVQYAMSESAPGSCRACGYRVGELRTCPECGAPNDSRERHTDALTEVRTFESTSAQGPSDDD